jgi:hypothetical protein
MRRCLVISGLPTAPTVDSGTVDCRLSTVDFVTHDDSGDLANGALVRRPVHS